MKIQDVYKQSLAKFESQAHLDFGSGSSPRNPFQSELLETVDIEKQSGLHPTKVISPGGALPYADDTFTSVSAFDVLEHLSRDSVSGNQYIFYMNELHRVLKPGGIAVFVFPFYPRKDLFADPTHINFIPARGLDYFITNGQTPGYAGITTDYKVLRNSSLRSWKFWVYESQLLRNAKEKGIRRRISLGKRSLLRFIYPSHRIWILQKV